MRQIERQPGNHVRRRIRHKRQPVERRQPRMRQRFPRCFSGTPRRDCESRRFRGAPACVREQAPYEDNTDRARQADECAHNQSGQRRPSDINQIDPDIFAAHQHARRERRQGEQRQRRPHQSGRADAERDEKR
jgi:hypothetical protein